MCSASKLKTEGPYITDKTFYFHEETINIKCDEGFQLYYNYSDPYNYFNGSANDLQINATCYLGKIYLKHSVKLTEVLCTPSNYFYSCI